MKLNVLFAGIILMAASCASTQNLSDGVKPQLADHNTFLITEKSTDPSYGFMKKNPVKVGGVKESEGPLNERRFLNALSGPNGEQISYYRAGSCCPFKTKNGFNGGGMLDNYLVTWEGSKDTVSIYINMYDYGQLKAPVGFDINR